MHDYWKLACYFARGAPEGLSFSINHFEIKYPFVYWQSSEELRSSVQVLSERVSWLENNQDALMTQVEQCNRYTSI